MLLVEDKAEALCKLYNAADPRPDSNPPTLTVNQCRMILLGQTKFQCLNGKILNLDLSDNIIDTKSYDHKNSRRAKDVLGV